MPQIRRFIASVPGMGKPRMTDLFVFFLCLSTGIVSASDLDGVRIRLVNGSSIRATIESIEEDGSIRGSKILQDFELGQILSIETRRPTNSTEKQCQVRLANGGFIATDSVTVENDQVLVAGPVQQESSFPIEAIEAIVWKNSATVDGVLNQRSAENDFVVVETKRGEQKVKGFFEALDQTHVLLNYQGKSRKISRDKILAIVTADLEEPKPAGTIAEVITTDGSKMIGVLRRFRDDHLKLAVTDNFSMAIPSADIARINIQSDRIRYLSDMDPIRQEEQSQFAAARPWQRDASLLGNPIQLQYVNGRILQFDKGIGARSYTSIVYENAYGYDHVRAVVGIDMETGGQGDCEMVIEGDGIRLWSKRVKGNDDPEPIVVDIKGISEIALIVLPGENFDLADHANWADIRFTKSN